MGASGAHFVVQLAVKVGGELVQQRDDIDAFRALRVELAQQPAEQSREVEIERDCFEHVGSLHLDGDFLASRAKRRLVNLRSSNEAVDVTVT